MPTRILPILDRLRQDLAQILSPESIRSEGVWRRYELTAVRLPFKE
jgi:hypothetical protein